MAPYPPSPVAMPWSTPQHSQAIPSRQPASIPELHFFIERDDGSLVALVPVDELPDDLCLVGLPLRLGTAEANAMTYLGHVSSSGRRFVHDGLVKMEEAVKTPPRVSIMYTTQPPEFAPRTNHASQVGNTASTAYHTLISTPQHTNIQPPIAAPAPAPKQPTSPTITIPKPLYNERPLPPSGIEPDQRKKIYCTYWIQNRGQCAYMQQGCMYRHEMPEDQETLHSIGLKAVPAWWKREQVRKKQQMARRAVRNGVVSGVGVEWEEVERQQVDGSALHDRDAVRVRVPPTVTLPIKQIIPAVKATTTTITTCSSPPSTSPHGGVQLGAAKTPLRGPPAFDITTTVKKQTLESPIEEDLIGFEALIPSSCSDVSSSSSLSNTTPDSEEKSARLVKKSEEGMKKSEEGVKKSEEGAKKVVRKSGVVVGVSSVQGKGAERKIGKGRFRH
jgi:hypothetical protein